jgi:hypothetical protein
MFKIFFSQREDANFKDFPGGSENCVISSQLSAVCPVNPFFYTHDTSLSIARFNSRNHLCEQTHGKKCKKKTEKAPKN